MKSNSTSLRVLVVDDEPIIRLLFSMILKNNAEVKTVATAEEALDEIEEQHYDLCFLDINLPGMTGLDAMKIINERSPKMKVAIMTGSSLDEAMKEQIEDFVYSLIEKPYGISDIMEVVDRVAVALN